MKKLVVGILIITVLVLDLLALDDITTNPQPSFFGEYAMLAVSLILLPLLYLLWKKT